MAKRRCLKEYNSNAAIVQVLGVAGAGHRGAGHRDEGVNDNNIINMLGVVLVEKAKILKFIYLSGMSWKWREDFEWVRA